MPDYDPAAMPPHSELPAPQPSTQGGAGQSPAPVAEPPANQPPPIYAGVVEEELAHIEEVSDPNQPFVMGPVVTMDSKPRPVPAPPTAVPLPPTPASPPPAPPVPPASQPAPPAPVITPPPVSATPAAPPPTPVLQPFSPPPPATPAMPPPQFSSPPVQVPVSQPVPRTRKGAKQPKIYSYNTKAVWQTRRAGKRLSGLITILVLAVLGALLWYWLSIGSPTDPHDVPLLETLLKSD